MKENVVFFDTFYDRVCLSLDSFIDYLLEYSGQIKTIVKNSSKKIRFFNCYQSGSEFFWAAASVVSAPIALTLISLGCILAAVVMAIKSIGDLFVVKSEVVKEGQDTSVATLLLMGAALLAALVSPFLNVIAVLGNSVITLIKKELHCDRETKECTTK